MLVLRNEFRALIIDPTVVAFVPSDSEGQKRTGMTIRIHDDGAAAKTAASWLPTDAVFYYDESNGDDWEAGFLNQRTEERITTYSHHRPSVPDSV